MSKKICFATQGELLKLAYDAFGVLPRKEAAKDDFDEKAKKAMQKTLGRLAEEKGHLSSNFSQSVKSLSSILTGYLPSASIMGAIGDTLADVHDAYNELVRSEGTYLNKAETLRYFITIRAMPLIVMSMNRSLLRYKIEDVGLGTPDDKFWYLPSIDENGKLIMPLETVMRWAYQLCESSQTQFHYPGKNSVSDDVTRQNDLDNAINWTRGSTVPALAALIRNFDDSFKAMAQHGREISSSVQAAILTALVVARVTSYVAREILRVYGASYLIEVCAQLRDYSNWIAEDVDEFKAAMKSHMQHPEPPEAATKVWLEASSSYWGFLHAKIDAAGETLVQLHDARPNQPLRDDVVAALTSKYGRFAVCTPVDLNKRKMSFNPPEGFAEMVGLGFRLKQDVSTRWPQIDQYAFKVKALGLEEHLCWMEPWLRAVYHYRKEDYKAAMSYYQTAFEIAKYRAGRQQYDLVNQYIEVAAKNGNKRRFKKGIEWAQYLGIKVRWLRDDEPTEEKLNFVYGMLKMARYDHQI